MDLKKQIKIALGLESEEVSLGFQAKTEDGTIIVSTAEELEAGVDISVLTEDGTTIPLPIGTYKLDTGVSFRVEEEGVVSEVMESETEEEDTPKEEATKEEKEEMAEEDDKDDYDDEAAVGDWEGMEKRIKNLEDAVSDLKRQIGETGDVEEMSEEVEERGTTPKTIKTTEVVEFSAEEEIEKLKAENEKLKTELAESPADSPINTNKFSSDKPAISDAKLKRLTKRERIFMGLSTK